MTFTRDNLIVLSMCVVAIIVAVLFFNNVRPNNETLASTASTTYGSRMWNSDDYYDNDGTFNWEAYLKMISEDEPLVEIAGKLYRKDGTHDAFIHPNSCYARRFGTAGQRCSDAQVWCYPSAETFYNPYNPIESRYGGCDSPEAACCKPGVFAEWDKNDIFQSMPWLQSYDPPHW